MAKQPTVRELEKRVAYMDGIDWQHHLGINGDPKGAILFPSKRHTIAGKGCLSKGGRCGIVMVEVRLIKWVVEQRLDLERPQRAALARRQRDKRN